MRESVDENYQAKLADALTGPDAMARAALLISICAGVQLQRNILGSTALQKPHVSARVVDYLNAALDPIADAGVQAQMCAK